MPNFIYRRSDLHLKGNDLHSLVGSLYNIEYNIDLYLSGKSLKRWQIEIDRRVEVQVLSSAPNPLKAL
jgi:hypothetical protein